MSEDNAQGSDRIGSARVPTGLTVPLPAWLPGFVDRYLEAETAEVPGETVRPEPERRMEFVLALAERNIGEATGGPFAAAVFRDTGSPAILRDGLVAVGVNVVVPACSSIAHAEVMALALAQQRLGVHDLARRDDGPYQLVASAEMCAMCLGATAWSGVSAAVWSASTADVESIVGFDEGPRPPDPTAELASRGIATRPGVLRDRGREVLATYVDAGGEVYNSSADR